MSARPIGEYISKGQTQQYTGAKIKLSDLIDKSITIRAFTELPSKLPGQQGQTYVIVQAELNSSPVIFTTSSKVIKDNLNKVKSVLPVTAVVRHLKAKNGIYSYYTFE